MADQPKQKQVWNFATGSYLQQGGDMPAVGNTMTLGTTGTGKTIWLSELIKKAKARPPRDIDPNGNPDADSGSTQ